MYHFLPAVPFGCLAVAMAVADGWRRGGAWRPLAAGYVVAVVAAFAFFYPIYTSWPLTPEQLGARMWLPGWR
jgi:dolichyl-phosphate-mannose--protein O-mannosyl transferase